MSSVGHLDAPISEHPSRGAAALGYEPVGFTRSDAALAACQATPKKFDALLVDHLVMRGRRTVRASTGESASWAHDGQSPIAHIYR